MGRPMKYPVYDEAKVLEVAEEIVNEFGHDYIYVKPPSNLCQYVHEGQPSCLVGQILVRLGAQVDVLEVPEHYSIIQNGHGLGVTEFLTQLAPTTETLGFTLTRNAIAVLECIQNTQDTGNTWGRALEEGRRVARELRALV